MFVRNQDKQNDDDDDDDDRSQPHPGKVDLESLVSAGAHVDLWVRSVCWMCLFRLPFQSHPVVDDLYVISPKKPLTQW